MRPAGCGSRRRIRTCQSGLVQGRIDEQVRAVPSRSSARASRPAYYDPKTKQFTLIDTCFGTHHLQFAEDADNTLVFSDPGGQEVGWINTRMYDQTSDEKASQGWCPTVIDTNGDGKITKPWNQPARGRAVTGDEDSESAAARQGRSQARHADHRRPLRDHREPGRQLDLGLDRRSRSAGTDFPDRPRNATRPQTCITERYMLPKELGYRPRGIDVDRNGVVWTALAGSAQLASFDRRKCKVLNGPATADGRHCDEGWTFYQAARAVV